ncbi:MAG: UvrD-helicase domain-containing protein [Deinococcales bacterium]
MQATDEQQQIIAHDRGCQLVFAVAGAGKTTTMVKRIERLRVRGFLGLSISWRLHLAMLLCKIFVRL